MVDVDAVAFNKLELLTDAGSLAGSCDDLMGVLIVLATAVATITLKTSIPISYHHS